jgi:uncharacterized membrane protein
METTPNTVVVMVLPDLATAKQAGHDVRAAVSEGRFAAADVVVATHGDGKVHLHHVTPSGTLMSFTGGAVLGGLAGLVVGSVLVPALALGSAAAVMTKLSDHTIPKESMETVGAALTEGRAALFVLTDPSSARIIEDETQDASDIAVYGLHPSDSQALADVADDIARALAET